MLQVFKSARAAFFHFFFLAFLLEGCYQVKSSEDKDLPPLYRVIPPNRDSIQKNDLPHWTLWALFGNDDDGIFGEKAHFREDDPDDLKKAFLWWIRNPFHNLFFYVIGSANRQNSLYLILQIGDSQIKAFHYYPLPKKNFPCKNSCFYLALHGGKPFVSIKLVYSRYREFQFYFGWRTRGNFGIKLNPFSPINEKN